MSEENKMIAAWESRIADIDSIVGPLTDERARLSHQILETKSEFKVGDLIEWNGKRGIVSKIGIWCGDIPMWIVGRILKDGTAGASVTVRRYDRPQKVNSPNPVASSGI